jgi:arylsulfatase A-like enzyme
MHITRRQLLKGAAAAAGISAAGGYFFLRGGKPRPNIVLIVADDMRYDAFGAAGNAVLKTPALDALAESGTYFPENFVTTSICPTSRASIYTGTYALRHGVYRFGQKVPEPFLKQGFPALLRDAGYHTGFVGKWGLGGTPERWFDASTSLRAQGQYVGGRRESEEHLTDRQTRQALRFLKERPSYKPFLLVVATKAPHEPRIPQDRFARAYDGVTVPRMRTDTKAQAALTPEVLMRSMSRTHYERYNGTEEAYQNTTKDYYALISGVDALTGELVSELEQAGLADSTALFFTSDNGMLLGEHGLAGKWCMYEESIRTPLIARLPGAFFPDAKPGRVDAMTLNVDLAPTLIEMAGATIPATMQGRSLLPLLAGAEPAAWREHFYYEHPYTHGGRIVACEGVRTRSLKYARYYKGEAEAELLFDVTKDPFEERNLLSDGAYAERLDGLRRQCEAARAQLA